VTGRSRFIADEEEVEAIFGDALEGILAGDDESPEDIFKERDDSIFSPRDDGDIFREPDDFDIFAPRDDDIFSEDEFVESEHPRGQPENAGQFVEKGSGNAPSEARSVIKHWLIPDVKAVRHAWNIYKSLGEKMKQPLSAEEKRAVDFYSQDGAWQMTRVLNGKGLGFTRLAGLFGSGTISKKDVERFITLMDSAVAKEILPQETKAYRGITLRGFSGAPQDLMGTVIANNGFTSVTMNPYVAKSFATRRGFIVEMDLPEGQPALHIGSGSRTTTELELVLPRNMRFKVVGVNEGKPPVLIVKPLKPT
jgi:hypothetical protein